MTEGLSKCHVLEGKAILHWRQASNWAPFSSRTEIFLTMLPNMRKRNDLSCNFPKTCLLTRNCIFLVHSRWNNKDPMSFYLFISLPQISSIFEESQKVECGKLTVPSLLFLRSPCSVYRFEAEWFLYQTTISSAVYSAPFVWNAWISPIPDLPHMFSKFWPDFPRLTFLEFDDKWCMIQRRTKSGLIERSFSFKTVYNTYRAQSNIPEVTSNFPDSTFWKPKNGRRISHQCFTLGKGTRTIVMFSDSLFIGLHFDL